MDFIAGLAFMSFGTVVLVFYCKYYKKIYQAFLWILTWNPRRQRTHDFLSKLAAGVTVVGFGSIILVVAIVGVIETGSRIENWLFQG